MSYLTSVADSTDSPDADALLKGIAAGDREALAVFYQATRTAVYGYALSVLKNDHDAQDVLHDCYLAIVKHAATYRTQGKPMAWVMTITRHLCLRKLREYKKTDSKPPEDWEQLPDTREGITADDRLVLAACMEHLSDEERRIVALHALAGLRHREIAGLLELPLPTVLSKYSRALKKLKQILEKENTP